jgi:polyhydroxyalkanoate synthesis regulator phasin
MPALLGVGLHWRRMEDVERQTEEERAGIEDEYRRVLKSAVAFEKRIRDRWRAKCREKNERIAELEERVAELERRLAGGGGR